MENSVEIWEAIKDTNNKVFVSNMGRIRSHVKQSSGRLISLSSVDNSGYVHVGITTTSGRKNYLVSRLVAEYFIDNPLNKPEVNHRDGDKQNNCASNLEWCTKDENMTHASESGFIKARRGEASNFAKINKQVADLIRESFDSSKPKMEQYKRLSESHSLGERQVRYIIKNTAWI